MAGWDEPGGDPRDDLLAAIAAAPPAYQPIGIHVMPTPHLRDGQVIVAGDTVHIGTRPLTDLEYARAEATHLVRSGFAEVLAWLGETVGPPPARSGRGEALLDALRGAARAGR